MARGGYTDSHPEKKIKRAQRGVDALSKRPVAVTFEPVEWHKFTVDNMSLGTSLTPINWTADDSEMDTFISPLDDAEHNTWELNAGDLEIWKDGAYDLQLSAFGITTNPNVDTVLFMSFVRITGPNPETARGSGINWFPNWIIRHDRPARFRFAALQSRAGAAIGRRCGIDPDALDTLVLVEGGKAYTKSTAALRIVRSVDGAWRVLYGLTIVPRPVRDLLYDWFARGRYRRFGKRAECMAPAPHVRERFLTEEAVRR